MKQKDMERRKNEKLNDLEIEAKENAEHLLSKANAMRQEQEDEIKHLNEVIVLVYFSTCNSRSKKSSRIIHFIEIKLIILVSDSCLQLILNAKCHAIRDAQILEKKQIKGEMMEEDKRLDVMMEVDRQNAISIQEEIEKKRKEERLLGAAKLLDQIQENEQERLFDLERKDQENIQMQKYIEKMMDEDRNSLEKKHAEQISLRVNHLFCIQHDRVHANVKSWKIYDLILKLYVPISLQKQEDLNKANEDLLRRREIKKEQEVAEEQKVVDYMKKKAVSMIYANIKASVSIAMNLRAFNIAAA